MKTQAKKLAVSTITAALMASLAPVPAQSATQPVTAVEMLNSQDSAVLTMTFNFENQSIFLPLAEAIIYMNRLYDYQRKLLSDCIEQRQAKGKGPLFTHSSQMIKIAEDKILLCRRIKDAIRIVLTPENLVSRFSDSTERESFRSEVIKFGRVVASSEYLACDVISAIKQSLPPKNTYHPNNLPLASEVQAMIAAEHKNLGLSPPEFF